MGRIPFFLIWFLLFFSSAPAQVSAPQDAPFLGIDPQKNFQDYGRDHRLLEGDINPFPLGAFIGGKHDLSNFPFDSEIILFTKQGELDGVIFSRLFSREEYGPEHTQRAKNFFDSVHSRLVEIAGQPVLNEDVYAAWVLDKGSRIQLILDQKTSVQLFYSNNSTGHSNSTFIDEPFDIEINEKTFTVRTNEDLDAAVIELFNAYLNALNDELVRSFARKNKNRLDIFFEREVDLKPSSGHEIKEASLVLEETLIKSYAEQVLLNVFDSSDDLNLLRAINVEGLTFKLDMFYGDGSESRIERQITVQDLEKLEFPLSRRDTRGLLGSPE